MNYPIRAREGTPYITSDGKKVTISEIAKNLSQPETQTLALRDLGIAINGNTLIVEFQEEGYAYTNPSGDRTKIAQTKSRDAIREELKLNSPPPTILDITTSLEAFIEDGINFFGRVTLRTPDGETRTIPMTGRGTAALEGRANDAHAGFCTGGNCASFQERVALVLAVIASAGATHGQIDHLGKQLLLLNEKYHGRKDILIYALKCAQSSQISSYKEFMSDRYSEGDRPALLQSILETGQPNDAYYQKIKQKMSEEELEEDRQAAANKL